jgi:hypothetical protein
MWEKIKKWFGILDLNRDGILSSLVHLPTRKPKKQMKL